jgi:hypothetical protein
MDRGRVDRYPAASTIKRSKASQSTAPTFKHTFGYHPLLAFCDNTGEFLAAQLRAGNACGVPEVGLRSVPAVIGVIPPSGTIMVVSLRLLYLVSQLLSTPGPA